MMGQLDDDDGKKKPRLILQKQTDKRSQSQGIKCGILLGYGQKYDEEEDMRLRF